MEIQFSVRGLVEFLLRGGDIDNRRLAGAENAMQEGSRIHREIQKSMGPAYSAEVGMYYEFTVKLKNFYEFEQELIDRTSQEYRIVVSGRADGILTTDSYVMVDEIKGTYRKLNKIKEPVPVHLAQAKCYAFFYAEQNGLSEIMVRLTYCNLETEQIKYFEEMYSYEELRLWYESLMEECQKWTDHMILWRRKRDESIKSLKFPFPYRPGQRELVENVYRSIYHGKKLFLEAPTGVGKTISTVYPSLYALGEGKADRLFYLTAKTITRTVAEETFSLLRENGLSAKSVIITAKEKICPCEETICNPENCPYAKGHFDRINECLLACITKEQCFTREIISQYAQKYQVCPFELSLDLSLYSDAIICDYNYVFDPHVYLKRFFAEGKTEQYIFLIDEAHNLVERGREMYSAELLKEDFLALKRSIRDEMATEPNVRFETIVYHLDKCNREFLSLKRECVDNALINPSVEALIKALERLSEAINKYLDDTEYTGKKGNAIRDEILDFYFEVSHFLMIAELLDEHYVKYALLTDDGDFLVKLFNVDPSLNLRSAMGYARSSVLFSATLLPIQYYKKLLGGTGEDYEVYADSTFQPEKRGIFISGDVTSKFSARSEDEYRRIAGYIREVIECRYGNYLVFFPSHSFLKRVYDIFMEEQYEESYMDCLVQESTMTEEQREEFLQAFRQSNSALPDAQGGIGASDDRILLGFCVQGGLFSEGIDLKKDSLIGAIIVGTGLPQVCLERELLRNYFEKEEGNGFDYAYRYPGMNKVLQSAGRVIRTAEDIGVVVLLDYRFLRPEYTRLFPREWENYEEVTKEGIAKRIDRFWNEWL